MLLRSIYSGTDKSLDVKIREGLKVEYVHELGKNQSRLSRHEFLAEYGGLTSEVLFIWEGYTAGLRFVHDEYSPLLPGHLPFKRLAECPNRVDVQPHPAILGAADALLATHPALQRGYIGVHMRRGDFVGAFGKIDHSVTRIAEFVKEVVVATGLHTIFLCTDGSPSEVRGCSIRRDFSNIGMPYKYHKNSSKYVCVKTQKNVMKSICGPSIQCMNSCERTRMRWRLGVIRQHVDIIIEAMLPSSWVAMKVASVGRNVGGLIMRTIQG